MILACAGQYSQSEDPKQSRFQLRHRPRLKIADLQLDRLPSLILIEAWREGDTALPGSGHQFVQPIRHAERDGLEVLALLLDAKGNVALRRCRRARLADDLHRPRQKCRRRLPAP